MVSRSSRRRGKWRSVVLMSVVIAAAGMFGFYYAAGSRPPEPQAVKCIRSSQSVDAILVDPAMVEIRPALAKGRDGESFEDMVNRVKPDAAINGTFYDENLRPLGDIVVDGGLVNKGHYPNALAVTSSGKVAMIRGTRRRISWTGYKAGIAAGPRLVSDGKVHLDPTADGFSMGSLKINARRSGVGITKDRKLILVTTHKSFTLQEFAELMIELGAVEALNFDGGGACGLYMEGKTYASPGLPMANILAVYKRDAGEHR